MAEHPHYATAEELTAFGQQLERLKTETQPTETLTLSQQMESLLERLDKMVGRDARWITQAQQRDSLDKLFHPIQARVDERAAHLLGSHIEDLRDLQTRLVAIRPYRRERAIGPNKPSLPDREGPHGRFIFLGHIGEG
jgi:hypothetical protein